MRGRGGRGAVEVRVARRCRRTMTATTPGRDGRYREEDGQGARHTHSDATVGIWVRADERFTQRVSAVRARWVQPRDHLAVVSLVNLTPSIWLLRFPVV